LVGGSGSHWKQDTVPSGPADSGDARKALR
jgi:hypothetical protein